MLSRARSFAWPASVAAIALFLVAGLIFAMGAPPRSTLDRIGLAATLLAGGMFFLAVALGALHVVWPAESRTKLGAIRRLLPLVGPFVMFIGMELVPHAANPCTISGAVARENIPSMCEVSEYRSGFGGKGEMTRSIDVAGRWHGLTHAAIGGIPMILLYRVALRKWRPDVLGMDTARAVGS